MRRLIVDAPNLVWRVAAATSKAHAGTSTEVAGLAMHSALNTLKKAYTKYKPDHLAVIFEGTNNWRKAYTKSEQCVSKRLYKGNRVRDPSMQPFFEMLNGFRDLIRDHTAITCLTDPILEGDDLFSGYVQRFTEEGDEVVGVSGDKDFVQLLKFKNFTLINPDSWKPRTLLDVCGVDDAIYFMFEKAIRGDMGDNVGSAFPRVRKTRIDAALKDDYELVKLMNETWTGIDPISGATVEYKVGDLFEENMLLMGLDCQPEDIRLRIKEVLDREMQSSGTFSFFHFTKFCGKYELKHIGENAQQFADMFSNKPVSEEAKDQVKKSSLLNF